MSRVGSADPIIMQSPVQVIPMEEESERKSKPAYKRYGDGRRESDGKFNICHTRPRVQQT